MEYSCGKKKTCREEFFEIIEELIPWDEWVGVIAPYYSSGKRGRSLMGIERMLPMYLLQIRFNLFNSVAKDAIYDSYATFTGMDFMTKDVPDETTLCELRRLLEENGLNKLSFDAIIRVMIDTGHLMKGGTIVDASNGLVHTIEVTAVDEHDVTVAANLIHDDEVVYGDSGYLGIQKRLEARDNAHLSMIDYRISRRPHSLPRVSNNSINWKCLIEHRKSCPMQSGARFPHHPMPIRLHENSVPGLTEKREPAVSMQTGHKVRKYNEQRILFFYYQKVYKC